MMTVVLLRGERGERRCLLLPPPACPAARVLRPPAALCLSGRPPPVRHVERAEHSEGTGEVSATHMRRRRRAVQNGAARVQVQARQSYAQRARLRAKVRSCCAVEPAARQPPPTHHIDMYQSFHGVQGT